MGTGLEKCCKYCITCSAMYALQWMGAVRMRVQTGDKNITIIHTTPVHQLMSGDKSWAYGYKSKIWFHNPSSSIEKRYYGLWTHILAIQFEDKKTCWWIRFIQTRSFKTLTDVLEWCVLLWCFYQTLILTAPIHRRASVAETLMLHSSKSDEEINSSTSDGLSIFSAKRHFLVSYSFK